ncbi:MAG: glucose-1-phosphate thymidylyltransferase RfbA [Alphaproteobacteria bacterium]|nr:glucose-1-phosphate thymidylyltransferase RfbA [Alphaproteobacteria bacterium]
MKGIILAGGNGTRLAPLTNVISKQLLPVYDKPMICYPLATLLALNIKEILIISTPQDTPNIEKFLGDGSSYGIKLSYAIQSEPKGIAEAFLIGEKFIGQSNVCLVLGDNIFYGNEVNRENLQEKISELESRKIGGFVFAYHVSDPERYGVVEFDKNEEKALSIEEKPKNPKSHFAVTGLYLYDSNVVEITKNLKPSARGELEITDINNVYLQKGKLGVVRLKRGFAWLDAGTPDSLLEASQFIHTIEKRQGLKIACLEEMAFRNGFVTREQFELLKARYKKNSDYRRYLDNV